MDPSSPPSVDTLATGLPRLSKLPQLRPTASQDRLSKLRPVSSVDALNTRASQQHTLSRKSSFSSFSRPLYNGQLPALRTPLARASSNATAVNSARPAADETKDARTLNPLRRPASQQFRAPSALRTPSRGSPRSRETSSPAELDVFPEEAEDSFRDSGYHGLGEEQHGHDQERPPLRGRTSRPSLSDRTVESLSHLPATVGPRRKKSGFFTPESPNRPPSRSSRPSSRSSRPPSAAGVVRSRPGTSDGTSAGISQLPKTPSVQRQSALPSRASTTGQFGKRSVSGPLLGNMQNAETTRLPSPPEATTPSKLAKPQSRLPPPTRTTSIAQPAPGKPTLPKPTTSIRPPARPASARPSSSGGLRPPSAVSSVARPPSGAGSYPTRTSSIRAPVKASSTLAPAGRGAASLSANNNKPAVAKPSQPRPAMRTPPKPPTTPTRPKSNSFGSKIASTSNPTTPGSERKASNSSAALREQIAKAKAAKKAVATPNKSNTTIASDFNFDFDLPADPFNQTPKAGGGVLKKRVDTARADGRLNIAAMGLTEIPEAVLKMYDFNANNDSSVAWGEVVDLVRFNAADNDIEQIAEEVFPDIDPENFEPDDDNAGPQFGGIEFLDFHGNLLREVPLGLRRLQRLTTLNLSRNRLTCEAFEIISQIKPLKDLRLADNALDGPLPDSVGSLTNLQNLELQGNMLSELPDALRNLSNLQVLNVADNQLRSLPMAVLEAIPLRELNASKNLLQGCLFAPEVSDHPTLQVLNVASNSLVALSESTFVELPALKTLNVSSNRIEALPDMLSCPELNILLASENKLQDLPAGFTSLQYLKNADFTSNDIVKVDDGIGLMDKLETLLLAANPLRDRKFLTMDTEQLKRDLRQRSDPAPVNTLEVVDELEGEGLEGEGGLADGHPWSLQTGGLLDLSSKQLAELDRELFTSFVLRHGVNHLKLQSNLLSCIPPVISTAGRTLTTLNLSHNKIDLPLTGNLELPALRELYLGHNKLSMESIYMLAAQLEAPLLRHLDITYNRLSGTLPSLRNSYPSLQILSAADNELEVVPAEALEGLRSVDLRNNSIEKLEPRIGLLAGTLTGLELEGNRFRVPSYNILKLGTERVLAWLRDKIPENEREGFEELFD